MAGRSRYSSAENSAYDAYEDDFEAEGDLEVGAEADEGTAAAEDSEGAGIGGEDSTTPAKASSAQGAAAEASTPSLSPDHTQSSLALDAYPRYDTTPSPPPATALSPQGGYDDTHPDQDGACSTTRALEATLASAAQPESPPASSITPGLGAYAVVSAAAAPPDSLVPNPSPPSPAPSLPPLNPTVSPYIARQSAPYHSTAAPVAPPPAAASAPAARPPTAPAQPPAAIAVQVRSQQGAYPPTQQEVSADAVPALSMALLQQASRQQSSEQHKQLAAAIRASVDAMRASEQMQQMQATVEALTQQLLAAERGRSTAETALVELTQRMGEQEKRLTEAYEAKLLEKQREVQQLRTKVQQLESQGIKGRLAAASSTPNPRGSQQGSAGGAAGGGGTGISTEEAAALRKELEMTDMLLRGYQQENEAATRRIKELEESLAAAHARAAEEVLRSERVSLLARDDVGRRQADTAAKLTRVLALEKELAGVREEAQVREAELRAQLEKLRAEKKALEAKSAGVDLKAMADGDVLVKQLREEMEAGKKATQALVQEMQAKLAWYAENQELLTKNDALVAEQRDTVRQLHERLAQYEGPGAKGPAATRAAAAQARVRELEAQVELLQKALRSRAPANSLAAVVAAARPSAEESALVTELRARVEELEGRLQGKDEEFEVQLRAYQQQFEKLKAQYAERAGRLEAATKSRGRVKELEKQLEEQKGIFGRRVRELEAKLKAAQEHGGVVPPTPAPGPAGGQLVPASALHTPTKGQQGGQHAGHVPGTGRKDDLVPGSYLRAKEMEVKKLQAELERKAKQGAELHLKLGEAESRIVRLNADLRRAQAAAAGSSSPGPPMRRSAHDHLDHDDRPVGPPRSAYPDTSLDGSSAGPGHGRAVSPELLERLEERCGSLTVENNQLKSQVAALKRELAEARRELEGALQGASGADPAIVSELRRQLDAAQLALTTVQRSASEAVEAKAMAAAEHQRAQLRLADEVAYREGVKWQQRLGQLEQDLRTYQQRCEALEGEVAVARSRGSGSWAPEAAAFAAMERRMDDMAREMAAREAKWRAVLHDTRSLHGVQSDMERKNWESALAAKEAEVQSTRSELQALLSEVAAVQELQARAVAAQARRQQGPGQVQAAR